jgi:hypothetical protein
MPTAPFLAAPPSPILQPSHPLAPSLRCFACIPGGAQAYEVVGRIRGTFNAANGTETTDPGIAGSPWGPALSCPTSAKDTQFVGRGLGNPSPIALTIFFVAKGSVTGFHEKVISTSTGGNGFYLGRGGSTFCLALEGAAEINSAVVPPTAAWFATAATIDFTASPFPIKFYIYNYETDALLTDSKTTTSTSAPGDGTAMIAPVNGTASGGLLLVAAAGFATRVWSQGEFMAWVADPFGPVRPRRRLTAALAATTVSGFNPWPWFADDELSGGSARRPMVKE